MWLVSSPQPTHLPITVTANSRLQLFIDYCSVPETSHSPAAAPLLDVVTSVYQNLPNGKSNAGEGEQHTFENYDLAYVRPLKIKVFEHLAKYRLECRESEEV